MKNNLNVVFVEWLDACSHDKCDFTSEEAEKEAFLVKTYSIGILVFEDRLRIGLAINFLPEINTKEEFSVFMIIPKGSVLKMEVLKSVEIIREKNGENVE